MNFLAIGILVIILIILFDYFRIALTGFQVSAFWGIILILSFFIPILIIVFYYYCIRNFQEVKKPFIRMHILTLLILGTLYMMKGPMSTQDLLNSL